MKRKLEKYLNSKEKNSYTVLDNIFEMYLNGKINDLLSSYEGVKVYLSFNEDFKTIQIVYNLNNIYVTIDFFEDKYNFAVYHAGITENELEKLFIDYDYPENFNLKQLLEEIDVKIKNHPKLKDTMLLKKKKKIFSIIAWVSLILPIVILGSIGLYCVISDNSLKLNIWWGLLLIVIPLIIWFIFDVKSKRIK